MMSAQRILAARMNQRCIARVDSVVKDLANIKPSTMRGPRAWLELLPTILGIMAIHGHP